MPDDFSILCLHSVKTVDITSFWSALLRLAIPCPSAIFLSGKL